MSARFGTGNDSSILYDGTNMVINPREVGSGTIQVQNLEATNGNLGGGKWELITTETLGADATTWAVINSGTFNQTDYIAFRLEIRGDMNATFDGVCDLRINTHAGNYSYSGQRHLGGVASDFTVNNDTGVGISTATSMMNANEPTWVIVEIRLNSLQTTEYIQFDTWTMRYGDDNWQWQHGIQATNTENNLTDVDFICNAGGFESGSQVVVYGMRR